MSKGWLDKLQISEGAWAFTLGECRICKQPVFGGHYSRWEDGSVSHYLCGLEAEIARLSEREAQAAKLIEQALASMERCMEHDGIDYADDAPLLPDLRAWLATRPPRVAGHSRRKAR